MKLSNRNVRRWGASVVRSSARCKLQRYHGDFPEDEIRKYNNPKTYDGCISVLIALEKVATVSVVIGSHKCLLDPHKLATMTPTDIKLERGDMLLMHEALIHAGSQNDTSSSVYRGFFFIVSDSIFYKWQYEQLLPERDGKEKIVRSEQQSSLSFPTTYMIQRN